MTLKPMATEIMHQVDISRALSGLEDEPEDPLIRRWVERALDNLGLSAIEVSVRIVDREEITSLNASYRKKDAPTNVLSFASDVDTETGRRFIGDIVLCSPVVMQESQAFQKTFADRYAHMLIHGLLHLLGHDHQNDDERRAMEALEIQVLQQLGISDPYEMMT